VCFDFDVAGWPEKLELGDSVKLHPPQLPFYLFLSTRSASFESVSLDYVSFSDGVERTIREEHLS
jgi:hypothetical protein